MNFHPVQQLFQVAGIEPLTLGLQVQRSTPTPRGTPFLNPIVNRINLAISRLHGISFLQKVNLLQLPLTTKSERFCSDRILYVVFYKNNYNLVIGCLNHVFNCLDIAIKSSQS